MAVRFPDDTRARVLRRALDEIVAKLVALDVEKIILFGSMARGRAGHSDP